MVQIIPQQGSKFTRAGLGLGEGIGGQAPQEMQQYRLSQGLKEFSQNAANMTPLEQQAYISSIPGVTPQMIQSFSELARQQAQAGALTRGIPPKGKGIPQPETTTGQVEAPKFPRESFQPGTQKPGQPTPSITTTAPVKATIENFTPPSYNDILDRAGQLYNTNPALYKNDPNNAIQAAVQESQIEESRVKSLQTQRGLQQNVQSQVQNELAAQREALRADIPENVYQDIEDEALDRVKKGDLTELQAAKEYGKELDKISRQYKALDTIGTGKIITKTPSGNKEAIKSLREDFKKRNDLENFADSLISKNKLSPSKAYYLAYPVSEDKELNNAIAKIPKLKTYLPYEKEFDPNQSRDKTLQIAPKIAQAMGKKGSPLAIAEELKSRGYDPQVWMEYLDKNREKLDLSESQGRQLSQKGRDFTPSLNDLWMFYWSGLDPIVEQQ
jgi:hypothetical protein